MHTMRCPLTLHSSPCYKIAQFHFNHVIWSQVLGSNLPTALRLQGNDRFYILFCVPSCVTSHWRTQQLSGRVEARRVSSLSDG